MTGQSNLYILTLLKIFFSLYISFFFCMFIDMLEGTQVHERIYYFDGMLVVLEILPWIHLIWKWSSTMKKTALDSKTKGMKPVDPHATWMVYRVLF